MKSNFVRVFARSCVLASTLAGLSAVSSLPAAPAFPGAQGFGANATGARGPTATVYAVTNLNDSGPGSLRDAVSRPNRYVVFRVGGIIVTGPRLIVSANVTIAGMTAPGDGITVYENGVSYSNANNTVTRYIRYRMGLQGDTADCVTIASGKTMMFDHVSTSWGRDETFSINGDVSNVTIQDSIISQGLDTHSCGGLMQSTGGVSIIRCLYIDNHTRNPKVKGMNQFVNNVVYNWRGDGYILGDSAGISECNVQNNYFIDGPSTTGGAFTRGNTNFRLYAAGNFRDKDKDGVLDGYLIPASEYTTVAWQTSPFPYPNVPLVTAQQAYANIINNVGAIKPRRDRVDARLISELTSLGTVGQIISNETVAPMNGPGPIAGGTAPTDSDNDGMPNAWETANGTNPNVADHNADADGDGYPNIEDYINSLVGLDGPPINGPDTYQSESATFGGGVVIEPTNGGYNGTGYANFPTTGGWLQFNNVDGNGGGTKTLAIRYALGATASRTGRLLINGTAQTITFAPTGSWTTWTNHNVAVSLNNSTTNTIRFESNGQDLGNIDQITVP
jgi:hypothetical protein